MIDRLFFAPRLVAAVIAVTLAGGTAGALAQSSADLIYLQDRVERLEAMLQIYGTASGPPDGDPTSAAALSMRIGQVEEQMRHLNGQVEQMAHALRQLEQRLQRFSENGEFHSLEGGASPQESRAAGDWQPPLVDPAGGGLPEPGVGEPPQIIGQVPGSPLDLTGALDLPGGFGQAGDPPADQQLAALPLSGDPRDDYDAAYGHILRGDFAAAEQGFHQFLAHYPDDELAGNAQYWLGESLFARGRYRDAADAFLAGYTEYPDSAKAPDSLFKLGLSLKELGQRDAACATLAEIDRRYPNAPQAVRERARSEMDKSGC